MAEQTAKNIWHISAMYIDKYSWLHFFSLHDAMIEISNHLFSLAQYWNSGAPSKNE